MTAVLAGPFLAVSGLLAVAGADKAWRPDTTAKALSAAGLPARRWHVRAAALVELAVGAGAVATGWAVLAGAVAASYLVFGLFVVVALVRGWPLSTCGCFATVDTPPTVGHVVLDAAAATVAAVVSVAGGAPLGQVLRRQPLYGIPMLLTAGTVAALMFLILTSSARLAAIRGERDVRPMAES